MTALHDFDIPSIPHFSIKRDQDAMEANDIDKKKMLLESWKQEKTSVDPDLMLTNLKSGFSKSIIKNRKVYDLHVPDSYKVFDSLTEKQIAKVYDLWNVLTAEEKLAAIHGKPCPNSGRLVNTSEAHDDEDDMGEDEEEVDNDKAHALNLMSISNSSLREESDGTGGDLSSSQPKRTMMVYNEEVIGKTREEQLREAARIRQRRKRERDRELLANVNSAGNSQFAKDIPAATTVGPTRILPDQSDATRSSSASQSKATPAWTPFVATNNGLNGASGSSYPSVNIKRFRSLPIDWEGIQLSERVQALGHLSSQTVCRHSALEAIEALKDIAYGLRENR